MKAVLFFIAGIFLANIIVATFIWPRLTTASRQPAPVVNAATLQGQDPWMVNERYNVANRDRVRKSTLETLDKAWSTWCSAEGHARLIRSINYYYGRRSAQTWSYGNTYGEAARRFSINTWTTADDSRITRLMGETYGRGYFSLDELASSARGALAAEVSGMRVSPNPCAN